MDASCCGGNSVCCKRLHRAGTTVHASSHLPGAAACTQVCELVSPAGPEFRRPSTLALWVQSLRAAGASVDRVLITSLGEWLGRRGAAAHTGCGALRPGAVHSSARCGNSSSSSTLALMATLFCSRPPGPAAVGTTVYARIILGLAGGQQSSLDARPAGVLLWPHRPSLLQRSAVFTTHLAP